MNTLISTSQLISSSEARKSFGRLLKQLSKSQYYVILDHGKVTAFLVHPNHLDTLSFMSNFPSAEELRAGEGRYTQEISQALEALSKIKKRDLPKLLR